MGYEAKYFDAGQPTPAGCHDCKNQIHGCWRQSVTAASLERGRGLAGSCIGSRRRGGTVHHVFQFLARLEIRDLLGRHLDARAGLRIASDARLALPRSETAETANLDLLAGAQRTHDTVKNGLYDDLGFFPRHLDYARDLFNQTGPGHVLFSLSSHIARSSRAGGMESDSGSAMRSARRTAELAMKFSDTLSLYRRLRLDLLTGLCSSTPSWRPSFSWRPLRSGVHEYMWAACAAGVKWPLPEGWDDRQIEQTLFPQRWQLRVVRQRGRAPPRTSSASTSCFVRLSFA